MIPRAVDRATVATINASRLECGSASCVVVPNGLLAVTAIPIVPLTDEGERQDLSDRHIARLAVGGYAHRDRALRNVENERAMERVPTREKTRPVAVGLIELVGVVDAVHARRDDDADEPSLEGQWQPQVRVMESRYFIPNRNRILTLVSYLSLPHFRFVDFFPPEVLRATVARMSALKAFASISSPS